METSENKLKIEGLIIEVSADVSYICYPELKTTSEAEPKWAIQEIKTHRPGGDDTYPVKTYYKWAEGSTEKKFKASEYAGYNYSWPK